MSLRRVQVLVGAVLTGLAGLAVPAGFAAALTATIHVAATQPPAGLLPGQTATSTVTLTNSGNTTVTAKAVITLPAVTASTPTITLTPATGATCVSTKTAPLVHTCTVKPTAHTVVTVGTLTGTPPSSIGSGVTASAKVKGPSNVVTVTWQWGLPRLVTSVTLSPTSIELGQWLTATLTVTNAGNGVAPAFITDTPLPYDAAPPTLISETAGTSCIPYDADMWCPMPGLAPGASNTVVWSFEPDTGPTNSVTSSADTSNAVPQSTRAGDVATSNVVTVAGTGARLTVSASNANPVAQGSNWERTVTVTNTGDTPAYNANIQDWTYSTFPLLATVSGGSCAVFTTSSGGGRGAHPIPAGTACTLGTVPAGGSASVTYELEAAPTVAANTYSSSLRVGTSTPQSNDTGSTASVTIVVPTTPVAPALLTAPGVPSGNVVVGDVLSTTNGTWNGTPTIGFTYHWSDCDSTGTVCTTIAGAGGSTYTVQPTDVGSTIEATVTASNGGGSASSTTPPTVVAIAAVAPTNTSAPVITPQGEPAIGITYTVSSGVWTGTPTITYAYQWYDCDSTGTTCAAIATATGTSYVSATTDAGHFLQVVVTASNSGGSTKAASNLAPTAD